MNANSSQWNDTIHRFWYRQLESYIDGLETRGGSVFLASPEAQMIEAVLTNLARPTVWIDRPMDRDQLDWMMNNCACDVWQAQL